MKKKKKTTRQQCSRIQKGCRTNIVQLVLQVCVPCVCSGGVLYSEDAAVEGWRVSSREQEQSSGHHYDSR